MKRRLLMEIDTAIKKSKGIDRLVSGYSPGKVEEERKIETTDSKLGCLLDVYEEALECMGSWDDNSDEDYDWIECYLKSKRRRETILSPQEMNSFLQLTYIFTGDFMYQKNTSVFLNRLLQVSYDAGHNEFCLNTNSLPPFDFLGSSVRGNRKRPLKITVDGNLGKQAFSNTEYVHGRVMGDVYESFASNCSHSRYLVEGNALSTRPEGWGGFGFGARSSDLIVKGDACLYELGSQAERSCFEIGGKGIMQVELIGHGAERCTFKARHSGLVQVFNRFIRQGNRVILVREEGEEFIRDFK